MKRRSIYPKVLAIVKLRDLVNQRLLKQSFNKKSSHWGERRIQWGQYIFTLLSYIISLISLQKRSGENKTVCLRKVSVSHPCEATSSIALLIHSGDCSHINTPVFPSTTVSAPPPRFMVITGQHVAIASTGTMPKSSTPGRINAFAEAYRSRSLSLATQPTKRTFGEAVLSCGKMV